MLVTAAGISTLEQWSTPTASWPDPAGTWFCKRRLTGTQSGPLFKCVLKGTMWPTKSKILILWPFTEAVCQLLYQNIEIIWRACENTWLVARFWGRDLRLCISQKFPGDAGSGTTLRTDSKNNGLNYTVIHFCLLDVFKSLLQQS